MSVETDVAVLASRLNEHERSCNERMVEVRDTFVEVKSDIKTIRNLLAMSALSLIGTCLVLIVMIVLKKIGLN